jgi:hypothetical protein
LYESVGGLKVVGSVIVNVAGAFGASTVLVSNAGSEPAGPDTVNFGAVL